MIDIEKVRHADAKDKNEAIIAECIRLLAKPTSRVYSRPITHDEVLEVCRAYYLLPGKEAGGSLHIVLDDGNIDDAFVKWCGEWALGRCDQDDHAVDPVGWLLARLLLRLTEDERETIYEAL